MGAFSCAPALLIAAAVNASAADSWVRLTSPNFELYTNANEKRGKETILYFEQVRDVFMRITGSKGSTLPVRIIAFKSSKDFAPYNFRESAAAYYLGGWDRDYIVMGNIGSEYFPVALHEYTHLVVKHSGLDLPAWLNEGIAEVYSTLRPTGNKVIVGDLIPGRLQILQQQKWMDTHALMTVDHNSAHYNEKNKMSIFYAQSWALTHMLYLAEEYRPHFGKLLLALGSGGDPLQTFRDICGKTLGEVHDDLNAYMRGQRFYGAVFDTKLQKAAETPRVAQASEFESGMALLELLASSRSKRDQARAALAGMERIAPASAEAEESLAAMAIRIDDKQGAAKHLARASELGSKNPKFYFNYASFLRRAGEAPSVFVPQLERAVSLDPEYDDANYLLGHYAYQDRDFKKASRHLRAVRKVTDEQAHPFFSMLAYSNFEAGLREEALKAAQRARSFAKTPEDIARTESLLRYFSASPDAIAAQRKQDHAPTPDSGAPRIARPRLQDRVGPTREAEPGTLTVEGTVQQIDCGVNGATFHILSQGRRLRYAIDDPNLVVLKNSTSGRLDFTCGLQSKPFGVELEFVPKVDESSGTLGLIRSIEFK